PLWLVGFLVGATGMRLGHGTNATLEILTSSPDFSTEIRIRHSRGGWSAAPRLEVLMDTATSTCALSPESDSKPASVIVPTDFDCAFLITSMKGCCAGRTGRRTDPSPSPEHAEHRPRRAASRSSSDSARTAARPEETVAVAHGPDATDMPGTPA